MINRSITATVFLALALTPSAGRWHDHNASNNRQEIIKKNEWINAFPEKMPASNPVQLHSGGVMQKHKYHESLPDPENQASKATTNDANKNVEIYHQNQTAAQLWQQWERLLNESEFQQIPIIGTLLAERMRKQPDPDVYKSINELLLQPDADVPVQNKAILLDLLSEIATPDSLTLLLNLAEKKKGSSLATIAIQAISRVGDNRWDGKFHEELSPPLEAAWSDPVNNDQALLAAVGKAIAVVGAPEGVNQLLQTVSGSKKEKEPEETSRIKQTIAFDAIPQVRNPKAVPVLSTWIDQEPLGTPAFESSLNALAEIGSPIATQKIVDWAKDAPTEGARNLKDVLSKIDDAKSLPVITEAPNQTFQSPVIKDVIDSAAAIINPNTILPTTSAVEASASVSPLSSSTAGTEIGDLPPTTTLETESNKTLSQPLVGGPMLTTEQQLID